MIVPEQDGKRNRKRIENGAVVFGLENGAARKRKLASLGTEWEQ